MKLNMRKYMGGDCVDFITLTLATCTGYGGKPIYVNAWCIEAIREDDESTVLFVTGDNNAKYFVKESADAILGMIYKIKLRDLLDRRE